ncbi:MAG: VWA domain-containing protein [Gammaproteobacteria bacterium]
MRKKRRDSEVISIAFLDVITCGFGAIILLLVITRIGDPVILEPSPTPDEGIIRDLQEQLFTIRGEATVLNRELTAKREQLSQWDLRVARLSQQLADINQQLTSISEQNAINSIIKGELELALQQLTAEMQRLLGSRVDERSDIIGGVPIDSEYIIFIIDTSGSMFQYAWDKVVEQLVNILDVYPEVKGMQIMSDMGNYMYSEYRGKWIPDTPARRNAMVSRLRTWNPFSNSSPVEGIVAAISTFYDPDKKISLYVFGDDFTGRSIKEVIDTVYKLNPRDAAGKPGVRIHGIGFPVLFANPPSYQIGAFRFATLMRELARQNGGTFVGLNTFR